MSLRSLLRSVVEWIRPPRRVEPELRITPEQLRAALSAMLSDPETRRLVLRDFAGTVFPISGGACGTSPGDIMAGEFSCAGNYNFTGGNVGVGTTDPKAKLSVGSGSLLDTNLPLQISTAGNGTKAYYGANKNGGYGVLFGFENQASLGTGGIVRVVTTDPLMFFVNNTTEAMRIISSGQVGIGTASPIANGDLPVQISTGGSGTKAYYGANKNGAFGVLFGFENQASLGTGGIVRVVSADPLMFVVNNTTEAMRIISNGYVGIGFSTANPTPLGKLHVKGGNLYIEGPGSVGRLGFLKDGATNTSEVTELWREGETDNSASPNNILLQTRIVAASASPSTLLAIKAPRPDDPFPNVNREATLTLGRDLSGGGAEFLDLYNNFYTNEMQYGIRVQRRGSAAQLRDFVIDKKSARLGTNVPLMRIKTADLGEEVAISTKLSVKAIRTFTAQGSVSTTQNSPNVTGTGTFFTQEIVVGDVIRVLDISESRTVTAIGDDTHLTVDADFTASETSSFMTVISASRFPGSESIRTTEGVKTTNTNPATIATIPLNNGRAYYFVVRAAARKSDGTVWAFLYKAALVRREGGVSVVEKQGDVGSQQLPGNDWTCFFEIDPNNNANLLVRAQTPTQTITVNWAATIEYQSVSTDI